MKLYFRPRVWTVGVLLIAVMIGFSRWQWERRLGKLDLARTLDRRLEEEPVELERAMAEQKDEAGHEEGSQGNARPEKWAALTHRRVWVEGAFDFDHEVALRNRKYEQMAGVFLLTPLELKSGAGIVLVNRGFIPLEHADRTQRGPYRRVEGVERRDGAVRFVGLVKAAVGRRLFAPSDPPTGPSLPWVDQWFRPDIPAMEKQLPYPLLPFYLEMMDTDDIDEVRKRIFASTDEKTELLSLVRRQVIAPIDHSKYRFPVPVYDTIVPEGRHLMYVFEWAFMALMTFLACVVLSFRPPRKEREERRNGEKLRTAPPPHARQ